MIEFPAWEKHKQKKAFSAVITPLMDIMFLILLFFFLTAVLPAHVLPVTLSNAESAVISDKKNITVIISKEGSILIENTAISSSDLISHISKARKTAVEIQDIVLAFDKDTPFHYAAEVLDLLRAEGIENVSFMMEESDE